MKSNKYLWIAMVVITIIAVGSYFQNQGGNLGASGTRFPNGLSADTTSPVAGEVRGADLTLTDDAVVADDLTVNGRSLLVTTSNTSTSTASFGCWQTTSTSTATIVKIRIVASTTAFTTVGLIPEVSYGACP